MQKNQTKGQALWKPAAQTVAATAAQLAAALRQMQWYTAAFCRGRRPLRPAKAPLERGAVTAR